MKTSKSYRKAQYGNCEIRTSDEQPPLSREVFLAARLDAECAAQVAFIEQDRPRPPYPEHALSCPIERQYRVLSSVRNDILLRANLLVFNRNEGCQLTGHVV
jgi:hypothetical protein